jgi:hypothetical protein
VVLHPARTEPAYAASDIAGLPVVVCGSPERLGRRLPAVKVARLTSDDIVV